VGSSTASVVSKSGQMDGDPGSGRIPGGEADSHRDHRMAMALAVAGLVSQEPVNVLEPDR